jgi:hypothetical protein
MTHPLAKPLLLVALVLVLPLALLAFTGECFAAFADRVESDPPSATTPISIHCPIPPCR